MIKTNQSPVILGVIGTIILILLCVGVFKGVSSFWLWSNAKVIYAEEQTEQEIFKRKECAIHYYALLEDYETLVELVMKKDEIADSKLTKTDGDKK